MKKLMIAAAAAAISAGASAATSLVAQVYDVNLTVKTTTCKEINVSKTIATLEGESYKDVKGTKVATRKQTSTKIAGVIWGCECETIANPLWRKYSNGTTIGGYLFWNVGADEVFNIFTTTFKWAVFNRIYKGDSAEGVWGLVNDEAENTLGFIGAGFGKVNGTDCNLVLKNMSGNFAGFILAGSDAGGCKFCGSNECDAWQVCPCTSAFYDTELTAAYGSWKIKYNKSASQKLKKTGLITKAGVFGKKSANAKDVMGKIEAAAAKGAFEASDDDDEDVSLWPLKEASDWEEQGEEVTKEAVGAVAYSTGTYGSDSYTEGEAPDTYEDVSEAQNALVALILALVDAS